MSRFINPIPQYILSNGDVAAAGTLTFYEFNTDNLLTIYGDEEETTTIANPIFLGDRGEVPNVFFSVAARAVLADASGNEIFDVQPTASAGGGSGGINGWVANTTYGQLSIVFASDAEFYISNVNENVGNNPVDNVDDSPNWTRLEFLRRWNDQQTFEAGDFVVRNQKIYTSTISDNLAKDPATDVLGNWLDLTDSSVSPYDDTSSGLAASTVKSAIDQLKTIIDAIVQPFSYLGTLDVSAGDGSLPVSPTNGDLYVIGIGGTITVSEDGGAESPTVVTVGQRIVWNEADLRWDLLPFSQIAADISYSNVTSGLASNNVQLAIDEVDTKINVNIADIASINSTIAGLGDGVTYKGQLDVSAGDSSLPLSAVAGDLYQISVGGTITVSVSGGAATPTLVSAGQQIVFNGVTSSWDLLTSISQADEIFFDGIPSGLSANNVQDAIDEVVVDVDANTALISANTALISATTTVIPYTAPLTLVALRVNELRAAGTYTLPLANSVAVDQIITITLPLEYGTLLPVVQRGGSDTITGADGITDTSITFGGATKISLTSDGVSDWGL